MTVSGRSVNRERHEAVRYVQFRLVFHDGSLTSIGRSVAESVVVHRRAIHGLELSPQGTVTGLYEFAAGGDRAADQLEAALADAPDVVSYAVSRAGPAVFVRARTVVDEVSRRLLEIPGRHGIVVETPMEYTTDGDVRVVAVSELATFRDAVDDLPETVGVRIELTGDYTPGTRRVAAQLTERQRETVRTAMELGYYEEPRQGTYEDVADEMGIAPETVGEHLRKAEATLVHETLP